MVKKKSVKKTTKKVSRKPAKKAVKKKSIKKKTAKKAVKKSSKKTISSKKAKGEECFFLNDGTVITNLMELANALDVMGNDIFYHHVTEDRHDFSNWVKEVMKEAELAEKLLNDKTSDRCQITILRHFIR